MSALPKARWIEALRDGKTSDPTGSWGYGSVRGEEPLRREIASWLFRIRGLSVHPDRIIVTAGTAQSLLLIALSRRAEDRRAFYCENPSIPYARKAFARSGYDVRELAIGPSGPEPPPSPENKSVIYLNPSNRFPRGGPVPPESRGAFLDAAGQSGGLIIEDDYDAEFRFSGLPLEPMAALAPDRVLYLGSFSKALFSGLRTGYIVASDEHLPGLIAAKQELMMRSPPQTQRALARFMAAGHLDNHVRKMKKVYARRANEIQEFFKKEFPDESAGGGFECGYHYSAAFPDRRFDKTFFNRCSEAGIAIRGEGHYSFGDSVETDRLVIGLGNIRDDRLMRGLSELADIVRSSPPGKGS